MIYCFNDFKWLFKMSIDFKWFSNMFAWFCMSSNDFAWVRNLFKYVVWRRMISDDDILLFLNYILWFIMIPYEMFRISNEFIWFNMSSQDVCYGFHMFPYDVAWFVCVVVLWFHMMSHDFEWFHRIWQDFKGFHMICAISC